MKVKGFNGKEYYWRPKLIKWDGKSPSKLQKSCKDILFLYWAGDVVAEEQIIPSSKLRYDFVNFSKKIIVEANGQQHESFNKFFHGNNVFNFVGSLNRDEKKKTFAEKNGFLLIEVKSPEELNRALFELKK